MKRAWRNNVALTPERPHSDATRCIRSGEGKCRARQSSELVQDARKKKLGSFVFAENRRTAIYSHQIFPTTVHNTAGVIHAQTWFSPSFVKNAFKSLCAQCE